MARPHPRARRMPGADDTGAAVADVLPTAVGVTP